MKRHLIWILEFLLWALIIATIAIFVQYEHSIKIKNEFTGYVFFQDADGLVVGSPVKFAGVQVGYVSNIKIMNGEAYINFVITNKKVKIPRGSIVSIEFAGLACGKSLEIYPPTEITAKKGDTMVVIEPIRIQNVFERQNSIAANIVDIGNQVKTLVTKDKIKQIQKILDTKEVFANYNEALNNILKVQDKNLKAFDDHSFRKKRKENKK